MPPITALSTTEREVRIEHIEHEVTRRKGVISAEFIGLGALLCEVRRDKLFLERGLNTFEDWLDSPEVDIGHSLAYDLVRLTNLIASGLPAQGIIEIGVSKARLLLPMLEEPTIDTEEWIAKAQTLSWRDLSREVRGDDNYEDARYSGRGWLRDLVTDMEKFPELWEHKVRIQVRAL